MAINFLSFRKENIIKTTDTLKKLDSLEEKISEINLYEYKLYEISKKTDSLITLANKINFENEKTNNVMLKQDNNLKNIDLLIQEEIDIINQLSIDIHTYKESLDKNIENFKSNKEKLLKIVTFIKEIKEYIVNLKDSSNNMLTRSHSILNISQAIKRISDQSKSLSLNAQIESAKITGNHIGFNVLSDEMALMASDTKENSILIDNTINIIINDIDNLNNDINENVDKIEESIVLCHIIVDFVEALNNEYTSNIEMFNRILDSMNEIILFIEKIKESMKESYSTADTIFKNTSSECIYIEGLIEESYECKQRTDLIKTKEFNKIESKTNDTLKILLNYFRDFINNPLDIAYEDEKIICNNIFDTLFKESKSGTPIPVLVKGWTDESAKIWTLYLKNNIYFSNGAPVTAEDVEFSIIRTFLVNSYSQPDSLDILEGHKLLYNEDSITTEKISGIEIVNDKTIRFKLKEEDLLFLSKLASTMFYIVSKKEYLDKKKFIGTGAYYIDDIEKPSEDLFILKLKSNIYNKFSSPYIKNVEITMDKNFKNYINNLTQNTVDKTYDIIYTIAYSDANKFLNTKNDSFKLLSENSYSMLTVNFIAESKNKLIQDKDFRQSIFSILNNMDLSINGISDYYIKSNILSNRWYNNGEPIPKWLSNQPILSRFDNKSTINILTYPSPLTKVICEKIKKVLSEKGLKSKIHILDEYSNLENFDLSVGIYSSDTNNLYSQLYDSISAPYGSCLINFPIGNQLKESNKICNYKLKNTKLKELEIEILKQYYNLPIGYIKRYMLQGNNILNLSTGNLLNLKFENIIKKSNKSE